MKKDQNFFLDVLGTITKYFLGFVMFIIIVLLCSGIRIIDSGNVALVLRFGKLVGNTYEQQVHQPGLLFAFPSFIDEVIIIPSDEVMEQSVDTHYTAPKGITGWDGGYLITGDQNIAVVSASVKYSVSDPVNYALHIKDVEKMINSTVSTAMINEAAKIAVDDLLTSKKDDFGEAVKRFSDEKIEKLNMGVEIIAVELTKVSMPNEVKVKYDEVNAANVKAETMLEQANAIAQGTISMAHQKYDTLISQAKAVYSKEVASVTKEMAEFWGCLEEYENAPDVLTKRLSAKKVVEAIQKIEKVRLVQDGETNIIINP